MLNYYFDYKSSQKALMNLVKYVFDNKPLYHIETIDCFVALMLCANSNLSLINIFHHIVDT